MKHSIGSLRFSLDETGAPLYLQLMQQIQQGIRQGELEVSDKLPSSRSLASALGVSRSTTTRAYEQLIAEGWLLSEEKRGVFVAAYQAKGQLTGQQLVSKEIVSCHESPEEEQTLYAFDAGVDVSVFPSKEWAASMRRSWLQPDDKVMRGEYLTGFPPLKKALVNYLYRLRGLECCAEQIIITAGNRDSLQLLDHALSKTTQNQLKWWLEEITYPPISEALNKQVSLGHIELDSEGPRLPNMSNLCDTNADKQHAFIMTPNRQYPLGTSISSQRRQQWIKALDSNTSTMWLIEDDYDNEFIYQGRAEVPLMQTARSCKEACRNIFYVGSFSKVLFRGLRLGFIVAPLERVALIKQSQKQIGISASLPMQPVVADFLIQGNFERHLNRMRRHYRLKRDMLLSLLNDYLSPWFYWKKPRGGLHVLIECKPECLALVNNSDIFDRQFCQRLRQDNVILSPLSMHYSDGNKSRQGFVLGFSGLQEAQMQHILSKMKAVLQAWSK
ncbi:PLP-dependent aminotransferase family protein [Marinomonas sp. THO17]|uniref:MocR-like pyridoxine biosynthesis transcription factor PdxR n=1 Tax=Marinomonas sp. THO17 TaxID=3149048 RepID=UPI00336C2270